MSDIDILLERYLLGFKNRGHVWEVFENPDQREIKDLPGTQNGKYFRFIADAKNKKVYVFGTDVYHSVTWNENIRQETNDSRWMYKDPTLFAGAFEDGEVLNWGFSDGYYTKDIVDYWLSHPTMFDFAKKYKLDITAWMTKNKEDMEGYQSYKYASYEQH